MIRIPCSHSFLRTSIFLPFFSTCFWDAWKAQDILLFFVFYTFFVIILNLNFFFSSFDIRPYYHHCVLRPFVIILVFPYTVTLLTSLYSFLPLPFFKSCFSLFSLVFYSLYFCSIFLQLFPLNFVVFEGQWNPRDFMCCAEFRQVSRLLAKYSTSRSVTFIQLYKEMYTSYPFNAFTPRQLYTELTNLVLCCIILV